MKVGNGIIYFGNGIIKFGNGIMKTGAGKWGRQESAVRGSVLI